MVISSKKKHFIYGFLFASFLGLFICWMYYPTLPRPTSQPVSYYPSVRQAILNNQVQQVPDGAVMLIGDSITDGMFITSCVNPVFNAGIGSATVETWNEYATKILKNFRPGLVVITLGINNTSFNKSNFDIKKFENNYKQLCSFVHQNSSHLVISTILPVGKNMPLGDKYFDMIKIKQINEVITKIANQNEYELVDAYNFFADHEGCMPAIYTVDGVHLNADGYAKWKELLSTYLPVCPTTAAEGRGTGRSESNRF